MHNKEELFVPHQPLFTLSRNIANFPTQTPLSFNKTQYRSQAVREQVFKFQDSVSQLSESASIKQKFNLTLLGKLPQQHDID